MLQSTLALLKKYDITPLKKYSQNFILDQSLCNKIARYSGVSPNDFVIEIGAGPGCLTRALINNGVKNLLAIELDNRLIPILHEIKQNYPNLIVENSNALNLDLCKIVKFYQVDKVSIISNLPYNVSSPIIISLLRQVNKISKMTLMLQKELVNRIVADVGTKLYGRLSVICRIICSVEKYFDVKGNVFYPEAKVDSSVFGLTPSDIFLPELLLNKVEEVTKYAFAKRRKMIKCALSGINVDIENILISSDIDPKSRAENVSPAHYLKLAKMLIV